MLRSRTTDIPSEDALIRLTLDRLDRLAVMHDTTPRALCRRIVRDSKIYDRLRSRPRVDSGARAASVTLALYGRLHKGLDKLDLPVRERANGSHRVRRDRSRTRRSRRGLRA